MSPSEIRNAREILGLTQAQLAEAMGYGDKARVSELERGIRKLSRPAEKLLYSLVAAAKTG